jgi:hypothetical protein
LAGQTSQSVDGQECRALFKEECGIRNAELGVRLEIFTTETHGKSRKMKLLRRYFLFSAAGGLMFPCNSVKNPWLKKIKIRI